MALPRVVQLIEFQSGELFERESRGPGTYIQYAETKGNSILSSVFIESIAAGATLKINYYDTTTSPDLGERYDLVGHDIITDTTPALTTFRILVTRIHHRIVAEAIVTGGAVSFSLYATVVSSSASDLDQSLVEHLQDAVITEDKGIVVAGYDAGLDKFFFLPIDGGAVKITGTVSAIAGGVTTPLNTTVFTDATPNTENNFTLSAIKRFRMTNRGKVYIYYSFQLGGTVGNYATLPPNATIEETDILSANVTIYLKSPSASQRVEVVSWS